MTRENATATCLLLLTVACLPATAETIPVYSSSQVFGPYELDADNLAQAPAGGVPMRFEQPVWLVGYETLIVDESGKEMPKELQCHTMLMTPPNLDWMRHRLDGRPFKGVFSDGYTRQLQLPVGYGIYLEAAEPLDMIPMFNNRETLPQNAAMKVQVNVIRPEDLPHPLTPLYATQLSVNRPHLYEVAPGVDDRQSEIQLPYSGTIHAMAVHVHPYGRVVEMVNKTKGETVFRAEAVLDEAGEIDHMPVYSSKEGYPFGPDDVFVLRAVYENPTEVPQDAMAGFFVFFATEDGKLPAPPAGSGEAAGSMHDHGR